MFSILLYIYHLDYELVDKNVQFARKYELGFILVSICVQNRFKCRLSFRNMVDSHNYETNPVFIKLVNVCLA